MSLHTVTFGRDEFAELLDLETDIRIERIEVAFSPMMQEWSLLVDLRPEVDPGSQP